MKPNEGALFNLLLKNLPKMIHCSKNKSGANSKPAEPTHIALSKFPFIEFNSKERTTIVVFDKDTHEGQTAREYFGNLQKFHDWLLEMVSILPNYICETTKGYQFGFVINGFRNVESGYAPKNSPQQFLNDIKCRYIDYLELDTIASSRNRGIFRNPLLHPHIEYPRITYNLNDINDALPIGAHTPFQSSKPMKRSWSIKKGQKILSHRNNAIFKLCCREFAHTKPTKKQIFGFANKINNELCYEPLPLAEIRSITSSIYKYAQNGTLKHGAKKAQINRDRTVKERKKLIMKYFLTCKKHNIKPKKAELARNLGISVTALNSTYGEFIQMQMRK